MAKAAPKKDDGQVTTLDIELLKTERLRVRVIGTESLIYNCVSEKARRELLLPRGKMTEADKAGNIKHDPIAEYRSSVYRWRKDDMPTRLMVPSTMFKGACLSTALRLPKLTKTSIGQLVTIRGVEFNDHISVYGIPQLRMDVVRMADMARTPDIRTRAILLDWCCEFDIFFHPPFLNHSTVANLVANSGQLSGIGDFRQEKGKGSHGQFRVFGVGDDDDQSDWKRITKLARAKQDEALADPSYYDAQTEDLFAWMTEEVKKRGRARDITYPANWSAPVPENAPPSRSKRASRGNGRDSGHEVQAPA